MYIYCFKALGWRDVDIFCELVPITSFTFPIYILVLYFFTFFSFM